MMDASGRIYAAAEDEIPTEDAARLDGYLRGKAETDAYERMENEIRRLKAQVEGTASE